MGVTHYPDERCPFTADHNPVGIMGTCCSLRGKGAARELEALGEAELASGMFSDMTAEGAVTFAVKLDEAVDRLEREHAGKPDKPRGAGWNGTFDRKSKSIVWGTYSTFEEAIAEIRTAARWYKKVGGMGFGVHAWY